jgi:GT2 family glycosyltransferase
VDRSARWSYFLSAGIAVVVVSHESQADLPSCLEALLAADGVQEVVVVDNCSRDRSRKVVREVGDRRVRLVQETVNTGFAGGCNRGYRELADRYPILAFLNPDVAVEQSCLRRAANALQADEGVGAVAPRLMRSDGTTVDSVGQRLHPVTLEVSDRGYGQPLTEDLLRPSPVLAPCGALAVFRTAALSEIADEHGPWAQHFFCFWEDLEIGWRLANLGWRIRSCPEAVATHGRGAGAVRGRGPLRWRRPPELEACILSNRWMTLVRHLHPLDLLPRLPLLLMWDLGLLAAGAARRPALVGHLRRRWPMVRREWRERSRFSRRRLHELV